MGFGSRIIAAGLIHHIINRGNNHEIIFVEQEDYEKYLGLIYRFKKKYEFKLFAYCLMTNHIHLLIQPSEKGTISKIMQSLTVAHTRHYHYKYQRCGHLWQGRFFSPIVSDDQHMLNVMLYIEQNPLRAKMVADVSDYKWSSYKLNTRQSSSKLIDRDDNPIFQALGKNDYERAYQYEQLMRESIDDADLKAIRKSACGGHYISDKFKEQIADMLPKKRRRGRPSKTR